MRVSMAAPNSGALRCTAPCQPPEPFDLRFVRCCRRRVLAMPGAVLGAVPLQSVPPMSSNRKPHGALVITYQSECISQNVLVTTY